MIESLGLETKPKRDRSRLLSNGDPRDLSDLAHPIRMIASL